MSFPQPNEEHAWLKSRVGKWNAECRIETGPDSPPIEFEGTHETMMLGEFWLVGKFEALMMGMPYTGRATLGFELESNQFVSTWFDSLNPVLYRYVGGWKERGKVLEMKTKAPGPLGPGTLFRSVETFVSPDQSTFEMFASSSEVPETLMAKYTFRRA